MAPPRRYPWEDLRRAYVEGLPLPDEGIHWPTFDEAVEYVNRARGTTARADNVRKRAAVEKWADERKLFQAQLQQLHRAGLAKELAESAVEIDSSALRNAKAGLTLVGRRLREIAENQRTREQHAVGAPDTVGKQPPAPIHAPELSQLALSAKRWHDVGVRALGLRVGDLPADATEDAVDDLLVQRAEAELAAQVHELRRQFEAGTLDELLDGDERADRLP